MKIDIRDLKKINQILSENKEIKKREYNKTDNLSNRKWFIIEYTQPLTPNLKEFIEQAQTLDIDLTSSLTKISIVNKFYDELTSVINDYGKIDLIHTYNTDLNHKNDSIDFENKRIVKRYFYPNDKTN
tara:strand:- start:39 stop:422 length:384 start_codon:yes stop_codon:yes gene_type:complete